MAAHRSGRGPHLVLFHGGMGSWKHWIRNVEPLAARFTVHALDHPSYGASAPVPRETTGPQYLDLVHELILEMLPGDAPLRFAGFSFGGAIAAHLARGDDLLTAVRRGKAFVTEAIRHGLAIGQGIGPVDPLWRIRPA